VTISGETGRPAVSVIIATNRGGGYLDETVRSVADQTFDDWELVIVDDGSDDPEAIRDAVKGMDKARVVRQENSGISVARNVGFAHSSGEFVAYLDDDDLWKPEKLARQVDALRAHPSAGACHSGYWFVDGAGRTFGTDVIVQPASTEAYLSGEVDIPRINTMLVRRSVIERLGGFLSNLSLYEDCELVFRVVQEAPVISLPEQLVGWRRYPESVSFTHDSRTMNAAAVHAVMIAQWGAQTQGHHVEAELLLQNIDRTKRRLAERHASEFCHLARSGRWREAYSELNEGIHNSPATVLRTCVGVALRTNGRSADAA
jgi:glycosyltransferase involved in cell wall biosynthesis